MSTFSNWTMADVARQNEKAAAAIIQGGAAAVPRGTTQLEIGPDGIQDEIETWLKAHSHCCWYSRSRTDKPTTNRRGTPDFIGCWYDFGGMFFAAEVKRPGRKTTPEQEGELAWIRKVGGIAGVVHSLEEFKKLILGASQPIKLP